MQTTALHDLHIKNNGYMVDFAGFHLPLYYKNTGMFKEHCQTRSKATVFDVSHMGQVNITGDASLTDKLSYLVTADLTTLKVNHMVYTTLTNDRGGVIDDCIITKREDGFFIVVNAARKEIDLAHLQKHLQKTNIELMQDQSLIAIQGPEAINILAKYADNLSNLNFMTTTQINIKNTTCWISRCGYTGEDGFELSIPNCIVHDFIQEILHNPAIGLAGLAARDSLRLEAGLCLYGHELTEEISPVEANLTWCIAKSKRTAGSFMGSDKIIQQIEQGTNKKLIGLAIAGKLTARENSEVYLQDKLIGKVTSGGYSPSLNKSPIAIALVDSEFAQENELQLKVRNKMLTATPTKLPFVAHKYYKK